MPRTQVPTGQIQDYSLINADIANDAGISASKIADGSVSNAQYQRLGAATNTNAAGTLVLRDGSGNVIVNLSGASSVNISGDITTTGKITGATKEFRVPDQMHPGKYITYACMEGKQNSVFVRGTIKANFKYNKLIRLPKEWDWLVDKSTITVHLTPRGFAQSLVLMCVDTFGVKIRNTRLFSQGIYCDYLIIADRKDIPKLEE